MQGHEGIEWKKEGRKKRTNTGAVHRMAHGTKVKETGDAKGETARRDRRVFWLSVGSRSGAMCSVSSCSNL